MGDVRKDVVFFNDFGVFKTGSDHKKLYIINYLYTYYILNIIGILEKASSAPRNHRSKATAKYHIEKSLIVHTLYHIEGVGKMQSVTH